VRPKVAIVYNEPGPCHYQAVGEEKAALGVLDEVEAVHQALLELGYLVLRIPLVPLEQVREKLKDLEVGLVFNLFEGFCGYPETEAEVPEILSELGIPYTGNSGAVLKLALDKAKTKAILQAAGIHTPRCQMLSPQTLSLFQLGYPCIVKPCSEDASHGLSEASVVSDFASLEKQVIAVSNCYRGGALVEEFIDGREFNATVLGNAGGTVLPVSEIVYSLPPGMPRILTFAAKWEPDDLYFQGTKAICPAQVPPGDRKHIADTALAVYWLLGCRGYARVDMRLDGEGRLNVIEVNPNPDISPGSGAARQAEAAGMTYPRFINEIVLLALKDSQP
jgi:D-alanine-D-alanine ligase